MATVNYFVSAKKKIAPIYVRLTAGRGCDLIVKSGLHIEPAKWSNKTQTIRQRITTKEDNKLIATLAALKKHITDAYKSYAGELTKVWLSNVISRFHNITIDDNTLNSYISSFINKAETGGLKNKRTVDFADGTIRSLKGFQRIFNEFQGIYTDERLQELKEADKEPRELRPIDFTDITVDFHADFVAYMSNEGYKVNTINKTVKSLKYFMRKSLVSKKHNNREFMESAFGGFAEDSHAVYLTLEEIEKIYRYDLSASPRMDRTRDAFVVLCELGVRVSDYKQITPDSIKVKDGRRYLHIHQVKTGDLVVIPLTQRMDEILAKYNGRLPVVHEQHINEDIKKVAKWCKIDEVISWPAQKFGKKYTASAKKWELIVCHSGRRSAATNLYKSGIPTIDIMRLTGHRSESSFMRYIRITAEEAAERMAQHSYFRNGSLKAV